MKISVIIPAFNEAKRILPTTEKIEKFFSKKGMDWQLILVDDGSTDGTSRVVEEGVKHKNNIKIIRHPTNMGKGAAVKSGMLSAEGDYVLFMDADSSTEINEFEKFVPFIEKGIDVIVGSRKVKGAQIKRKQSFLREFFGKGFTLLSNLMLGTDYSDFTCGFKCFKKGIAQKIARLQTINNWSFDSEILFLVRKLNLDYVEIPIKWTNDPASNVRILRDIITSFFGLIEININRFFGKYEQR